MKRLILILPFIPSLAFATYTEFYCQSGGSNLSAGSTNNNTPAYTSAAGNWVQSTRVFTPTDSSNPSSTVSVGDWGSVYITAGATVAVYVARVSAVQNATNGTITFLSTNFLGSNPSNGTGTMTITIGGAWKGPNAASGFPLTLLNFGASQDSSSHLVRLNMKNDQTYSITSVITPNATSNRYVVQGYTSSVADGGKATWDGSTSTSSLIAAMGPSCTSYIDHVFTTSMTSGSGSLFVTGTNQGSFTRCVFSHSRGFGLQVNSTAGSSVTECEAFDNNKANGSATSGFSFSGNVLCLRSIAHDNAGSNTSGFIAVGGGVTIQNCISETNGQYGISVSSSSASGPIVVSECDIYNNTSDGININSTNSLPIWIENTNLVKNGGAGINNASTAQGGFIYNCGYGSGTQANGSGDTLNNLVQSGTVTYASGVTPWVDAPNGDFRNNLATSQGAGRGSFTETASSYAGTIGYPDISAAQANIGVSFPTPTPTPSATATPTPTPTPTEVSYGFPG